MKSEKWAAYLRVSTGEQSVENQRTDLEKWLEQRGIASVDWYSEAESTRKTRPIKQQLLRKAREGEYAGIIVWQLSRWARSMAELAPELESLCKMNVSFVSIKDIGEVDNKSSTGKLLVNIIGSFAEFERDIIRDRTMAGLARAAKGGRHPGRPKGSKDGKIRDKSGYYLRYAKNNRE